MRSTIDRTPKLLVIAYYFPPDGSVGTFRISKFVKYLMREGWDIKVITVKELSLIHI